MKMISFYYVPAILPFACGFYPLVFTMAAALQASHPHSKKEKERVV